MKKIMYLLCICFLSLNMVNAQSVKENNIFKYVGTKDYKKYIPIYGRPNNTLVLKIYPAQEYMGSWMKSSEYPRKTYIATYDGNGLLTNVDSESENERSVYTYSNTALYCITRYNKNTGSRLSTDYPNDLGYGKRGETRITVSDTYFTVWFNTEKDGGLTVDFSACAVSNKVYYINSGRYRFNSGDLRKECGLSWVNHTGESDAYNPVHTMLRRDNSLLRSAIRLDSNGIPLDRVRKYSDVVSYNNYLIIGNDYYEYTWTY
ncbi:MAG: hypothetical protein IK010_01180 [Bacteroidales bacterium]|nr:hypothetical protein [Bacteroidales bacterium]